jgi:hypothetical protein
MTLTNSSFCFVFPAVKLQFLLELTPETVTFSKNMHSINEPNNIKNDQLKLYAIMVFPE